MVSDYPALRERCDRLDIQLGIGEGWTQIAHDVITDVLHVAPGITISAVKSKFGDLDVNLRGGTHEDWAAIKPLIERARERSHTVCETCGRAGTYRLHERRWAAILCDTDYLAAVTRQIEIDAWVADDDDDDWSGGDQ